MPPSRTDLEFNPTVPNTLSAFRGVKVPKTRNTVRATPNQLSELNKVFQDTNRPTKGVRESLAERTGLTTDWISSWFMRQRKKGKSVRYKPEFSQSQTIGHMLGITEQPAQMGPGQSSMIPGFSSAATTAVSNTKISPGSSWPTSYYPSTSSAPFLSPSISTAHSVISLPGLDRNYIQIQTTINNSPLWHVFPSSHTSTITSQPIGSTASSSSLGNPNSSSNPSYQVAPHVPQNPHFYQSNPSKFLLVKEVPRELKSFYASADQSQPADTNKSERGGLLESVLNPHLGERFLGNATPRGYWSSNTSHTGGPSTGIRDEKRFPSGKHEDVTHGNVPLGGTFHNLDHESTSAKKRPHDDVVLKTESETLAANTGTDTFKYSASESRNIISTPASETETAVSPTCQIKTESGPESDTETTLEPMSEAEAWKKARAHPDFGMFLKMAGVDGDFELTDNGLVFKS